MEGGMVLFKGIFFGMPGAKTGFGLHAISNWIKVFYGQIYIDFECLTIKQNKLQSSKKFFTITQNHPQSNIITQQIQITKNNQTNIMNHQQYQPRNLHSLSQEHLQDRTHEDEMKQFKVSQLISQQKPVETLSNNELIEYCHNEWKLWMASLLELKTCTQNQNAITHASRQPQDKKQPSAIHPNNTEQLLQYPTSSQSLPTNMILPAQFYQQSFQQAIRSQNMHYMNGNQRQSRPSYMTENRPFPFPFNPEMQQGQGYGQMVSGRGQQQSSGEMGK